MKKILTIILLINSFLLGTNVAKAQGQVELVVSQDEVEVGEAFQLAVGINQIGAGQVNMSQVQVPGMEKFEIRGTSTSTQIQVVNGQSAAATTTTHTLVATDEGSFTLGPVNLGGSDSNAVTVKVDGISSAPVVGGKMNSGASSADDEGGGFWLIGLWGLLIVVGVLGIGMILSSRVSENESDEKDGGEGGQLEDESGELPDIKDENYSAVEIRKMTVSWLERTTGKKLSQLSTAEIKGEVNARDGKMGQAVSVLDVCDQAIYARQPIDEHLLSEYKKLSS